MTIEEKRSIYAKEARDNRNALSARLAAIKDDSELAKHIRVAPSQVGAMNVTVNVVSLTEERRRELMEKKQRAIEWQKLSETRRTAIDHV
jgi:ribosome recycling factor